MSRRAGSTVHPVISVRSRTIHKLRLLKSAKVIHILVTGPYSNRDMLDPWKRILNGEEPDMDVGLPAIIDGGNLRFVKAGTSDAARVAMERRSYEDVPKEGLVAVVVPNLAMLMLHRLFVIYSQLNGLKDEREFYGTVNRDKAVDWLARKMKLDPETTRALRQEVHDLAAEAA